MDVKFLHIEPKLTSQFIGEYDDIPHKYKSIIFSFCSEEDDYEKIIENIRDIVNKLGY